MKSKTPFQLKQTIVAIRKQAGMTLMEIIAALAIIAAVVVGALSLFNSASSSNQAVTMLKDVIAIRAAVQQLYLGQGGYIANPATAINTQLHDANKYPNDLIWSSTNSNFITSWGGTLSVSTAATTTPGDPNFTITLTKVPPEICSQLVTNASNGWSKTVVAGATTATVATTASGGPAYPAAPALANSTCGTDSAGAQIDFTTIN